MRNFLTILLTCVILFSCGDNGSTPQSSIVEFQKKLSVLDFEGCKEYCTEDTKKLIGALEGMMAMMDESQREEFLNQAKNDVPSADDYDCSIEGNTATCIHVDGEEVTLKLVDGKWLIDVSKEDLNKEDKEDL